MFKKYAATAMAMTLLTSQAALAEAPTSQFGFKGWPYRQQTNCAVSTCAPEKTPDQGASPTLAPDDGTNAQPTSTAEPIAPTAAPIAPTRVPSASSAPEGTPKPTATQRPSMDDDYTTESVSAQEQKALKLLNADRAANGLPALTLDAELSRLARLKSTDMRDNGYFAHESPTYGRAAEMLRHFGYSFNAVGENIAHHANVDKSEAAFMSSDGHRRNILSASWTKVGIGIALDRNGFVYLTQLFVR